VQLKLFKKCGGCKGYKPYIDFHNDRSRRDGKSTVCKPCGNEKRTAYTYRNPNKARVSRRKYRLNNPGITAKTKAVCPFWADKSRINSVYKKRNDTAALLSCFNQDLPVDHIVPVVGKARGIIHVVCGLHIHYNLAFVTEKENYKKGNHTWPDMWDYSPGEIVLLKRVDSLT